MKSNTYLILFSNGVNLKCEVRFQLFLDKTRLNSYIIREMVNFDKIKSVDIQINNVGMFVRMKQLFKLLLSQFTCDLSQDDRNFL